MPVLSAPRRQSLRHLVRFKGQLLSWLGCPGVSPCHRLGSCQDRQRAGGSAAQRARGGGWRWRVRCGNSLLFRCRQEELVPRCSQEGGEAEAGPGQGTGGGSFAAQNRLQQQPCSRMGGLIACSLSMGVPLQLVRLVPIPVPMVGVLLGDTWALLTPLAVLLFPCAQCRQQRNMVMLRQSEWLGDALKAS